MSALLGGQVLDDGDPEEMRARMAVRGYSVAFDRCMDLLCTSDGPVRVTEPLIQDLYVDLFSPSVEAGIVDYFEALELATVDGDSWPFAKFVLEYVARATGGMDDADPAV